MNRPEQREGFVPDEPIDINDRPATDGRAPTEGRALENRLDAPDDLPDEKKPAPPPADDVDIWPLVVKLKYKPLQESKSGPEITELSFREPRASDIMRSGGNPCRIEVTQVSGNQWIYNPIIDDSKMIKLMMNLTGIAQPILERMDPRDYNSCAYRLRRFFLPEQGLW